MSAEPLHPIEDPVARAVFEAAGNAMLIVDADKRIVAANAIARDGAVRRGEAGIVGRSIGDLLGCASSARAESICGDEPSCRVCGALRALDESIAHRRRAEEECLLTRDRDGLIDAAELHVVAAPIDAGGRPHTLVVLRDISDEKRRRTLERLFVHDLNNSVASLAAWADLLDDAEPKIRSEASARVRRLTRKIVEELRSHSLLAAVESSEFRPTWKEHAPADVLEIAAAAAATSSEASAPILEIGSPCPAAPIATDLALLTRVLGNMIRNAEEAAPAGPIRLACEARGEGYRFSVHNPGEIPADVAARIFKRSFSTKAARGRGLGTYSMKLFGERILGGRVGFDTSAAAGTTFFVDLPLRPQKPAN